MHFDGLEDHEHSAMVEGGTGEKEGALPDRQTTKVAMGAAAIFAYSAFSRGEREHDNMETDTTQNATMAACCCSHALTCWVFRDI